MEQKMVHCVFVVMFASIFLNHCVDARHVFEGIPKYIMERWHRMYVLFDCSSFSCGSNELDGQYYFCGIRKLLDGQPFLEYVGRLKERWAVSLRVAVSK